MDLPLQSHFPQGNPFLDQLYADNKSLETEESKALFPLTLCDLNTFSKPSLRPASFSCSALDHTSDSRGVSGSHFWERKSLQYRLKV